MLSDLAGPLTSRGTASSVQFQRRASVVGVAALAAALSSLTVLPASAVPQTSTGSTIANVAVGSVITLTGLPASFTLSGFPGDTATTGVTPVTMNVETNNIAGYAVTVVSESATLDPADTVANPDTIPIAALSVRETNTTTYTPMSDTTPVTVHSQDTRSADGGDTLSNDFQVVIPFVNADTYSATLDYVATTL